MVAYVIYFTNFVLQLYLNSLSSSIYYIFIQEADCRTVDAFDNELPELRRCDRRKMKLNGQHLPRGVQRNRQSLRETFSQSSSSISLDRDKHMCSNGDQKSRAASACSLHHLDKNLSSCFSKKQVFSTPVQAYPYSDKLQHYIRVHCITKVQYCLCCLTVSFAFLFMIIYYLLDGWIACDFWCI